MDVGAVPSSCSLSISAPEAQCKGAAQLYNQRPGSKAYLAHNKIYTFAIRHGEQVIFISAFMAFIQPRERDFNKPVPDPTYFIMFACSQNASNYYTLPHLKTF